MNPLGKLLQFLRGIKSFVRLAGDMSRLDEIFNLSDRAASRDLLESVALQLEQAPRGKAALEARRRLPAYSLAELARLPDGTLGKVFAEHMLSRGLDPAAIPALPSEDRLDFVRAHLYETHDIWHAVIGFDTDVAGELGLQAFYMAQYVGRLQPMILSAGLLNAALFEREDLNRRMNAMVAGWVAGKRAERLFGIDWDLEWRTPLAELRARLGLDMAGVRFEGDDQALRMRSAMRSANAEIVISGVAASERGMIDASVT